MLKLAGVKKGDILYDLGSGDGRLVITAAKQYGVRGTGIDIDTVGGVVTLRGNVASADERQRAVRLARETDGVTSVVDQLTIR